MKRIYTAADPVHARLIVGCLAQHGIAAKVLGESLWSIQGELPVEGPGVWVVNPDDAERALELISEQESPGNPTHCRSCGYDLRSTFAARCPECGEPFQSLEDWTCPACGETCEGQFTQCWSCGADRPEDA